MHLFYSNVALHPNYALQCTPMPPNALLCPFMPPVIPCSPNAPTMSPVYPVFNAPITPSMAPSPLCGQCTTYTPMHPLCPSVFRTPFTPQCTLLSPMHPYVSCTPPVPLRHTTLVKSNEVTYNFSWMISRTTKRTNRPTSKSIFYIWKL